MGLGESLGPPLDPGVLLDAVPELSFRGLEQSPYHHLDTFEHTLEVARGVERELEEARLGARVAQDRLEGLRLSALHDVAKPVTRGELDGKVLFVSRDSRLTARLIPPTSGTQRAVCGSSRPAVRAGRRRERAPFGCSEAGILVESRPSAKPARRMPGEARIWA